MRDLICIIPVSNFSSSKTRLSSFLSEDERVSLLKSMIRDIVTNISDYVLEIFLVSNDEDVFSFAKSLGISYIPENEHDDNKLNNALIDAISLVKGNFNDVDILLLPSDIPLIKKEHVVSLKNFDSDLIISPSKGGGTNLLCFNSDFDFVPLFGAMSYFRHIEEANSMSMKINLIESFYLSLDVNTPEDLGEILLHGVGTYTEEYLRSLNIVVESSHGRERLNVEKKV